MDKFKFGFYPRGTILPNDKQSHNKILIIKIAIKEILSR